MLQKSQAIGIGLVTALAFGGCLERNSGAVYVQHNLLLSRVEALTAFPAVRTTDGDWARACGAGPADGVLVDVMTLGTDFESDNLVGVAPGDSIDYGRDITAATADGVSVALTCDEPMEVQGGGCAGWTPEATRADGRFVAPAATGPRHIVILIDQSGSTSGLVDAEHGNREAGIGEFAIPNNFGQLASDPANLRLAATRRLLRTLRDDDAVCVLTFGEEIGIRAPAPDRDLTTCLGTGDVSVWLNDEGGISSLGGTGQGRAPLWHAVDTAWTILAANAKAGVADHVLVISDGPDTCTGELASGCSPCANAGASFADVMARVDREAVAPVDFVQFAAVGYPDRDVRQLTVACATGGQYLFAENAHDALYVTGLQERLERAVIDVFASWDGVWRVALAVGDPPPGTAQGALYGLSGAVTIAAGSGLAAEDAQYPFGVLRKAEGAQLDWDHRLPLLRGCGRAADCGAAEPTDACRSVCSTETLLCADDAGGASLSDGTACAGGHCCGGACSAAGGCCSE